MPVYLNCIWSEGFIRQASMIVCVSLDVMDDSAFANPYLSYLGIYLSFFPDEYVQFLQKGCSLITILKNCDFETLIHFIFSPVNYFTYN
jgi:hypothetical protein